MKNVIIYASKHGCTKKVTTELLEHLEATFDVYTIEESRDIDLSTYDTVILGSSIYIGQIHKKMKKYIKQHASALREKQIAVYICRGSSQNDFEELIKTNFAAIYESIKVKGDFGGEIIPANLGTMEKKIIQMVDKKQPMPKASILHENILCFAKEVEELKKDSVAG